MFNITGINENIFHVNVNVDLMVKKVIQINAGITVNVDVNVKKHHICEKDYVSNPATCNCENGKYLASIMDDSTIIFDEVRESYDEEIKTVPKNFNKKCNLQNTKFQYFTCFFINYHCIIAVSIYYYLTKHPRRHLLPFHNTNNKLNKFCIDSIN